MFWVLGEWPSRKRNGSESQKDANGTLVGPEQWWHSEKDKKTKDVAAKLKSRALLKVAERQCLSLLSRSTPATRPDNFLQNLDLYFRNLSDWTISYFSSFCGDDYGGGGYSRRYQSPRSVELFSSEEFLAKNSRKNKEQLWIKIQCSFLNVFNGV